LLEGDLQAQGNHQAKGDRVSHFVGLDLGQSVEHTVLPQIRETQVPSTLSSSLCPENAEKASEAESE
jgi:hypothetical protein